MDKSNKTLFVGLDVHKDDHRRRLRAGGPRR